MTKRRLRSHWLLLSLIIAGLAGCGGSSRVMELPERARRSLIQRKVDVEPLSNKPARSGRTSVKSRTASPRP
jgi:hypothetical protein